MTLLDLMGELGVDAAQVTERFCGNEALMQRFICKFPDEKTFDALQDAFQEQHWGDAERAAHTLKGIAANLGFAQLYEHCTEIVNDLRGEQANLPAEFDCLSTEYERVSCCIRAFTTNTATKGDGHGK